MEVMAAVVGKSREQEAFHGNPAPDWLEGTTTGVGQQRNLPARETPCPCTCTSYRVNALCPPLRYVLEFAPLTRLHQKPGSREALISQNASQAVVSTCNGLLRYRFTCGKMCTEGDAADPFVSRLTAPFATVLVLLPALL